MHRQQQQQGLMQQQDPIMLPAQQHMQHGPCSPFVEAWQHGKLTLGFSGGGFLLPYHLGVYQSLAAMGIVSSATPMAGSSAGSLVVSGIKVGLSLQQQMDSFMQAAAACRQGGVNGRLRKILKTQLQQSMPEDAAQRCSDGTCWVSVTQVFPRAGNKLYGAFSSRQQLIKALLASCHLPRVSDGGLFTSYKSVHKRVCDGGFSNLCPVPPVLPDSDTSSSSTGTTHGHQQQQCGADTHPSVGNGPEPVTQDTWSATGVLQTAGSSHAGSSALAAGVTSGGNSSSSSAAALPTAPASALLLQRLDSTKGITTRLVYSRPRSKSVTGHAHKSHSYSRAASTSHASTSHNYSRSASMPQAHTGSGGEVLHSNQHGNSNSSSSGVPHASSSGVAAQESSSTAAAAGSSSASTPSSSSAAPVSSSSSSATAHSSSGAHAPQQGLWAQRRQRQQAEQLLASSCEVTGPGTYVAAPDWCAVRVCVLPARHMHEFPAMFRAPAAEEVAIALDMFQDWPHDLNATTALALEPQDDAFLFDLFTRGQQDAGSWAQQQGFPSEVLQRLQEGAADVEPLKVVRRGSDSVRNSGQQQQQQAQGGGQQEGAAVAAAAAGMQEVQGVLSKAGSNV